MVCLSIAIGIMSVHHCTPMPSLMTQTREQLSKLASPDEFEALATAVLRAAVPAYASLLHVGTNASGRAVRSPIDGIDIRVHRGNRHLLLVQHTITARKGLRRKWLNDKTGDCEELTSLFIALCRASKIPARTVWVPEHCYPEFYLVDDDGKGHWFPCQAAGTRCFGGIPELRPILQKGDNFKDPERPRERQRYVSEFLKGSGGAGKPTVKFIRQVVGS